ncbi:hypothetical protein FYJ24_07165 [Actinomycetaceae bacterium WB03_NA08]|uniref:Uncharacterized protein n=1 Tax=Scrofimicrobium canadense TaxID=2652290 RepID=A0A6N7W5F6_9ACTO|nr:hypothetical protein [Scrofimicrobium canadense]MSS84545.1 hypothetical protein [Scrofimicrobium canadense]
MNQEEIVESQEVLEVETSEVEPVADESVTDAPVESDASEVVEEEQPKGRSEAAKYRTRLRETEAERDALRERVVGMQQSVVSYVLKDHLDAPEALFKLGLDAGAHFAEDGTLDMDGLMEAADVIVQENGLRLKARAMSNRPVPALIPTSLVSGSGRGYEEMPSWQRALQRRH